MVKFFLSKKFWLKIFRPCWPFWKLIFWLKNVFMEQSITYAWTDLQILLVIFKPHGGFAFLTCQIVKTHWIILVVENLVKECFQKKIFWSKLSNRKDMFKKNCWSKKLFGWKNFQLQNFLSKKFQWKHIFGQNNFRWNFLGGNEISGQKNFQ